jgi:ribosomal protein S18 acetylase RimI-like enzyme
LSWRIQAAGDLDFEELTALVERCLGRSWSRASLEAALESPFARIRVALDRSGGLVGFVVGRRVSDILEIDLLGVAPPNRRCGAGAALLEALISSEHSAGAGEVRLELWATNTSAQALYAGLGFVVVGRRARYYPDGEDALLLTRALPGRVDS